MIASKYAKQIIDDLSMLPEEKILEVVDFVRFLRFQARSGELPLEETGLTLEQAADLRWRLMTFEEDWNAPGMEVYDEL